MLRGRGGDVGAGQSNSTAGQATVKESGGLLEAAKAGTFPYRVPRRKAVPTPGFQERRPAERWDVVLGHRLCDSLLWQQQGTPVPLPGTFIPKAPFFGREG